jgi:hypothetical protein
VAAIPIIFLAAHPYVIYVGRGDVHRAFEEGFRQQHPSITYPTPRRLTEGPTIAAASSSASSTSAATSALSAVQGPGGAGPRGQKRESTELTGEEGGSVVKTEERPRYVLRASRECGRE